MKTKNSNIVKEAISLAGNGSLTNVARKFEFKTTQAVANWILKNQIPAERVIKLCEMGNWQVTPHQLRPDIYPNKQDGLPQ